MPDIRTVPAMSRRMMIAVAVAVAAAAGIVAVCYQIERPPVPQATVIDRTVTFTSPGDVWATTWDVLGHDEWWDADLSAFGDHALSDLGPDVARAVADAAERSLRSYVTAGGDDPLWTDDPEPDLHPDRRFYQDCTDVTVRATSPVSLATPAYGTVEPTSGGSSATWAKVAVIWDGSCPTTDVTLPDTLDDEVRDASYDATRVHVSFVYVQRTAGGWLPVRPRQVPGSGFDEIVGRTAGTVDLLPFSDCGSSTNAKIMADSELVAAAEVLCQAAVAADVPFTVTSGYRTRDEQRERAEAHAGSAAPADDTMCGSRHCVGMAFDVEDRSTWTWLAEIVGCFNSAEATLTPPDAGCSDGSVPVSRAQVHGFAQPIAGQPWHVEYVLGGDGGTASCDPDRALSTAAMVSAVWRCELGYEGYPAEDAAAAADRAVDIAACVSGLNPGAVAAGGRFLHSPDPATGKILDGFGLFQLTNEDADRWFAGNWESFGDPVTNSSVAARRWLSDTEGGADPWSRWTCLQERSQSRPPDEPG